MMRYLSADRQSFASPKSAENPSPHHPGPRHPERQSARYPPDTYQEFHHPPADVDSFPAYISARPKLEFFGPKDYVPEVPHRVPSGYIQLGEPALSGGAEINPRKEYLRLEPKPR